MTYGTLISTVTVGATPAFISFSSIPQTYTDLILVLSIRGSYATSGALALTLTINSTGTGNIRVLEGTGTGVTSSNSTTLYCGTITGANATANTFGNASLYFPNYTSSTTKTVSVDSVYENNASGANQDLDAISASVLTGITSINIGEGTSGQGFAQYSTASLYGIK